MVDQEPITDGMGSDTLADLVAECLRRRAEGATDLPFDEICSERPDLIDKVRRAVDFSGSLPKLQAAGVGTDPLLTAVLSGRYRVDSQLGSGAMGVVYLGTDLDLGRRVAIKVVHNRFIDQDQAILRFDREAAALASISHEAVVTIHDRGVTESGQPFLVMEQIDGVSCSEILVAAENHADDDDTTWLTEEFGIVSPKETSLLRQMVRWVATLANGLEAAHAAGVFHRDVKPSNIMIRKDGRPVLLDFGISSREDDETLTRADSAIGTPAYMAPEALLGTKAKATTSRDVYGLAATLYHLLTLEAPYRGTPTEILAALATREPVPAFKLRPGLPRDAQAILDHGLARTPSARYQTPGAMERDLRALLAFKPVSVNPTSTLTRTVRRLRRSKAAVAVGAATLALVGLVSANKIDAAIKDGRRAAYEPAHAGIPANSGIVRTDNRFIADEELRRGVAETMDALVASKHDVVAARTIRAAFRLDHGDVAGAQEDMAAAAREAGTDYADELAKRYEALPSDAGGALALNLEDLPELEGPWDAYLAGYHAMRTNRYTEAIELMGHPGLANVRHARELSATLLMVNFSKVATDGGLLALTREISERAVKIDADFGYPSATTAHLKGAAAFKEERWPDTVAFCNEGLKLAPASHVMLQNASISSRRLNRYADALDFAERALEVVPSYLSCQKLAWEAEAYLGDYDAAYARLNAYPFSDYPEGQWDRAQYEGELALQEAVDYFKADPVRSKSSTERALAALNTLPEVGYRRASLIRIGQACLTLDERAILRDSIEGAVDHPFASFYLGVMQDNWPADLTEEESLLIKSWLDSVIDSVSRAAVGSLSLSLETK